MADRPVAIGRLKRIWIDLCWAPSVITMGAGCGAASVVDALEDVGSNARRAAWDCDLPAAFPGHALTLVVPGNRAVVLFSSEDKGVHAGGV